MSRLLATTALVAALALAGCSSDGDGDDVSTAGPSTTAAPATTATSAATTSTTGAAQSLPPGQAPTTATDPTAQQAGQRLIDAWVQGDIASAAAVAGSDVANALFAYPTPENVESLPCRGSETVYGATECDYRDSTGTITLLITGNASNGYRVTNVGFVPADPTTATSAP